MKNEFVTRNLKLINEITQIHKFKFKIVLLGLLLIISACASKHNSQSNVTLDAKIGQMIMIGFRGLEADSASNIAGMIKNPKIGGVVLFDYDVPADTTVRNIQSPEQLQTLTRQLQQYADTKLLISIDQEGGMVSRLKEKFGFPPTVSAQYLGELNNIDSTRYYAHQTAETLKRMGINFNLAPVLDLNTNPKNPVIGSLKRSFSADPAVVTRHVKAYVQTLNENNILTSLKHFPGHGSSEDDSHEGIVDVTKTWQQTELTPYKNLIEDGYNDVIMTAHIYNAKWDSIYPATLSKPVITGMLRDSLEYNGVVMSDDLQMGAIQKHYELKEAIRLSIQAGVDILTFANNSSFDPDIARKAHRIIEELIEEDVITKKRIDRSYQRIMQLKERI